MPITWKTVTAPNFNGANYLTKNAMDTVSDAISTGMDIARGIDAGRKQSKTDKGLAGLQGANLENFDAVVRPLIETAAAEGADVSVISAAAAQRRAALQKNDQYQYEQNNRVFDDALERRRVEASIRNMDQQYSNVGTKNQQGVIADNIAAACDGDVDCMRKEATRIGIPVKTVIDSRNLQLNAGGKLSPAQKAANRAKNNKGLDTAPKNLDADLWDWKSDKVVKQAWNEKNRELLEKGVKSKKDRDKILSKGFNIWGNWDYERIDTQSELDQYLINKNRAIPNPQ